MARLHPASGSTPTRQEPIDARMEQLRPKGEAALQQMVERAVDVLL